MIEREKLTTALLDLHKEMRFHIIGAKVPEDSWDRLTRNMDKWSDKRIEYIHLCLSNLRNHEWKDVHAVWTLPHVNEEMWENYIWMFDGKDVLEEQKLLTRARKALKAKYIRVRKDYKSFREEENAAKKIAAKEGARSNNPGTVGNLP